MGRPEKPLDSGESPLAAFAHDLRELRGRAGKPSYRDMARTALFSPSVLSSAANGRRLPTLQVTLAYVRSCGGNCADWEHRWRALARQMGLDEGGLDGRLSSVDMGVQQRPREPYETTGVREALPCPAQLPAGPQEFIGRRVELAKARGLIASSRVPLIISGEVGVGKTAFAVDLARRVSADFPDGQLYVDLGSVAARPVRILDALTGLLKAMGVRPQQVPDDLGGCSGLFRSLLTTRRILVVLDNAQDEHQIRPFLAQPSCSQVLVSSRARLLGLDGVSRMGMGVFAREESVAVLASIAGRDRVAAERAAAAELAELCDDLAIALTVVAKRSAACPAWALSDAVDHLCRGQSVLDRLNIGDVSVRARMVSAHERLFDSARRALCHLSREVGPVSPRRLAGMLDIGGESAEDLLEILVDAGLLRRTAIDARYEMSPLVRLFAIEQPDQVPVPLVRNGFERQGEQLLKPDGAQRAYPACAS